MQILIDIPDEQIKKSLEESKHIHEDEGEKGSVNITMLYTNAQLEFVAVERKTDFYSCRYKILPKEHGRLIDSDRFDVISYQHINDDFDNGVMWLAEQIDNAPTIIEAESEDK